MQADQSPTSELHPIKSFALLFLQQEEANGSEEGNIEKVGFLLPVDPHYYILQQPLRLWRNQIRPEPVVNRMLLDQAVHGTAVRGEVGCVSVSIAKEQKQIVSEFGWHLVDIDPERLRRRRMVVDPSSLSDP